MTYFYASRATHHVWRDHQFEEIEYPDAANEIIQRVSDRDRSWFSAHPDAQAYIRALEPGEFWPESALGYTHVYVRRIGERFRLREPIACDQVNGSIRAYYRINSDGGSTVWRACEFDEIGSVCRQLGGVA